MSNLLSEPKLFIKAADTSNSKRAGRCAFRVLLDQFGTLLKMILDAKVD
jgi:hypothetical protein